MAPEIQNDSLSELRAALQPVLRRVRLRHGLVWMSLGLLTGLALAGVVLGLARAFPWWGAEWVAGLVLAVSLASATIAAAVTGPGWRQAAAAADQLGLAERVITALELADQSGGLAEIQRRDALQSLRAVNPEAISLALSRRVLVPIALALAAVVLLAAVPNPMAGVARQQALERAEARRQAEKVGELAERLDQQVKEQGESADPRLREALEALRKLQKELQQARSGEDAARALARARESLQRAGDPSALAAARGLDQLSRALQSAALTDPAGKRLEDGAAKEAAEQLRQAAKALEKGDQGLTDAERQQLAAGLQQAANAARGAQGLSGAIRQLAQSLASGGSAASVAQGLTQLADAVQSAGSSVAGQAALAQASQQVGQMQGQLLASLAGQGSGQSGGGQAGSGQSGSGQAGSGQSGSGQSGSGQSGSGQSGSGQSGSGTSGSGQGSGSSGSGAGTGSSNGDGGQGAQAPNGNGGSLGTTTRPGQTGYYESIYAPQLLGGDGEGSLVSGTAGENGSSDILDADRSPATAGELVPYDRVWAAYEDLIRDSLDRTDLPPAMAELLRQYFASLEPGQ